MLHGFLVGVYIFTALLILLLVLVQPGKSSMGLGALGGGTQMLFGGSGGQSIFQKVTWVLGAIFMTLSLVLAVMKTSQNQSRYLSKKGNIAIIQEDPKKVPAPEETNDEQEETE